MREVTLVVVMVVVMVVVSVVGTTAVVVMVVVSRADMMVAKEGEVGVTVAVGSGAKVGVGMG